MNVLYSLLFIPVLWLGSYAAYMTCNHGLAPNARLQQFIRYLVASLVAVAPLAATGTYPFQGSLLLALFISVLWIVTYPLLFHLANRKVAPDYDHQIDPAFGIYLFGWFSGIMLLPHIGILQGVLLLCAAIIPVALWVYYAMYHTVIDTNGMLLIQNTDYNEVIEFIRYYPILLIITVALAVLTVATGCIATPVLMPVSTAPQQWWQLLATSVAVAFITIYIWKPGHGLFVRTGIAQLFLSVREYIASNRLYADEQQQRLSTLHVQSNSQLPSPHTIILVIGESASRDYMSAFTAMNEHTTPWMEAMARDAAHCTLFPNAYSCDIQTVPTLTRALTEFNQYDGGAFYKSCSIIDIAHRLGYHVHWYSNQGQLGAADTPITLIANTADVTKWTRQQLNQVQYDEALLDFLAEVDPSRNNLVVFHLMGSHFNYENRFTEATRQWGSPSNHDRVTNYKNSLYYTDQLLKRIHTQAVQQLNLQAMVYFSDHAEAPDRHRQPTFNSYAYTRIPMMVWLGDEYLSVRNSQAEALRHNANAYWTNDLAYELVCGIMDATSNHFRTDNSLASPQYRFTRDTLTALEGKILIKDDLQTHKLTNL